MASKRRMVVVGGGVAGLMATIKLCESGASVDLVSLAPAKRSLSCCARGGICAAIDTFGEADSVETHFEETISGGDFLANQPPVRGMVAAAPSIVALLDRMGVAFNRTPEGLLDSRRLDGTRFRRAAFAGANTGQQILSALDEQVRRFEVEGRVRRYERHDLTGLVRADDGRCVGVVVQDLWDMTMEALRGDAVCLATGGADGIFGRSTSGAAGMGAAAGLAYVEGALLANPEIIQLHPTAVSSAGPSRLISECALAEGGRIWVPKDPGDDREPRRIPEDERLYFLEDRDPSSVAPLLQHIASRAIFAVCRREGLGIGGRDAVYLDLTHLPRERARRRLSGLLESTRETPMEVFPAVHGTLGGLWVGFEEAAGGTLKVGSPRNQQTNVPGLFAAGEADFQYHGANRLGGNGLLSCIYGGMMCGAAMSSHAAGQESSVDGLPDEIFEAERKRRQDELEGILAMDGEENPFALQRDLGELMLERVTYERRDPELAEAAEELIALEERWGRVGVGDSGRTMNQTALFTRHLRLALKLARAMVAGALARDESRGAHFKPDSPDRRDDLWLKTTLATHTAEGPELSYEEVDLSLFEPRPVRAVAEPGSAGSEEPEEAS